MLGDNILPEYYLCKDIISKISMSEKNGNSQLEDSTFETNVMTFGFFIYSVWKSEKALWELLLLVHIKG